MRSWPFGAVRMTERFFARDTVKSKHLKEHGLPDDAIPVVVAALPRYRSTGRPFEAWAFRIARNAVIDHQRRVRKHEPLDESHERSEGDGLDALAVADEEVRELQAAISRLTPDQQEALALRFAAGLSADEAAAVMGRQAGTIRGLTFRAIGALRRHLGVEQVTDR